MGYQYRLREIRHDASVNAGDAFTIRLAAINEGIAPFYYPLEVQLPLIDGDAVVERQTLSWDIRDWLPGRFQRVGKVKWSAKPGRYSVALGIIDPLTDQPAIRFANVLPVKGGWSVFSMVEIKP